MQPEGTFTQVAPGHVVVELPAADTPPAPVVIDLPDFLAKEIPPRELLLEPWLPAQGLAMIHAMRGIGKTHLSLGVAYAVASGGAFLGWQAPRPRGVLFLDGEMPAAALQERLAVIVASSQEQATMPLKIVTPDLQPRDRASFNLADPDDQAALEPLLEDIALVVVDNLSTLCRYGKENEGESWTPVQEWALRQRAAGRSVLFIHHSGKSGGQRGTSRREDVLDTVIGLKRPQDYEPEQGARFEIHFEKARGFHGDEAQALEAMLATDGAGRQVWQVLTKEDSMMERVIELHQDGLKQKDIADELGVHKSTVSRQLTKAKKEGRIND